jgi:hypothetical protein
MKLDCPHCDVELRCDFLVRSITNDGMKNLTLPGTQRGRTCHGSALLKNFLCTRYQAPDKGPFGGHENDEIGWISSADKALHGE